MSRKLLLALLGAALACRTLPQPDDFGRAADAETTPADVLVADVPDAPTPVVCPDQGWQTLQVDVDGVPRKTCAPDSPVWGILPLKPQQLADRGDGTVGDLATQLTWQEHAAPEPLTWQAAQTHCDKLTLGGFADWRMPTFTELQSIVDFEVSNPSIDPPLDATPGDVFWSATTSAFFVPAKVGGAAWPISFDNGLTQPEPRSNAHRVRCVRSDAPPVPPPSPRFVQETANAVVDRLTRLEWILGDAVDDYTPLKAFGWCQHLNSDGDGGWHLSNIRELSSLIDRGHSYFAADPSAGLVGGALVQAGNFPTDPVYTHWVIDFNTGSITIADNDLGAHVRCVRSSCGNGTCGLDETAALCPMDCALPVEVTPATFWMGCDPATDPACEGDALPAHKVALGRFWIQQSEVMVQEWRACALASVCPFYPDEQPTAHTWPVLAKRPLNYVSWADAQGYCQKWLGAGWDLPTEAQWERAARGSCPSDDATCAGQERAYPWGNAPPDCDHARFTPSGDVLDLVKKCTEAAQCGCGMQMPGLVAQFPLGDTPEGVHDLAGNVGEWTRPEPGSPAGPPFVVRGGSFADGPAWLRATARRILADGAARPGVGFRCVKVAPE